MKTAFRQMLAPLFLLLTTCSPIVAQNTGVVIGTVRDATGHVPDATVELTNENTGVKRSTVTNEEGHYEFGNLQPGTYSVKINKSGFKTFVSTGHILDAGARLRRDAALTLGDYTETVTVEAGSAQINTETSTIGTLISSEQISKTLLNGRNYVKLALLVPGASYTSGADELTGTGPLGNPGAPVAINGLDNKMNSWNLDGARNVNLGNGEGNLFIPTLDSIQEVQIQTTGYTAEEGSTAGAVVNVISKSGSKEFHGSAYEYLRNDFFDARNAFTFLDRDGDRKADPGHLRQNNFGYSIGGPVILPRYNRDRNKTFFFWNHEWLRRRDGSQTILASTPTDAMRAGDFSAEAGRINRPLLDPANNNQPFPNNRMPANRINRNAALMLERYFPLPNNPAGGFQNFQNAAVRELNQYSLTTRGDHHFTQYQHLWGKWSRTRNADLFPNAALLGGTPFPTILRDFQTAGDTATAQLDSTFSPRVFNQFNVAWLSSNLVLGVVGSGNATVTRPPELTMKKFFPDADPLNIIPNISFTGGWSPMGTGQLPLPKAQVDHWTIRDDFSLVRGDHSLRFGALVWRYAQNQWTFNGAQGSYNFNGRFTNHPVGDFLLGLANTYSQRNANFLVGYRFTQFESYAQDNWRANQRLSVNLGLRLFVVPPIHVVDNKASSFDPARFDPAKAPTVLPNNTLQVTPNTDLLNGIAIAGQGVPRGFAEETVGWAPRIGFSYDLRGNGKMVLRGGYGIGYQNYGNDFSALAQQVPFLANIDLDAVPFDDPAQGNPRALAPQAISGFDPNFKRPYSQNWSLGIQTEAPGAFVVQITYVGNKYTHGERWANLNQPLRSGNLDFDPRLNTQTININTIRPFPGYTNITFFTFGNDSRYDSLQISFQRRFVKGFALQGAYTFAKAIGTTAGNRDATHQDNYNPGADRGLFTFDRTHSFVVNYIYELPILRGRKDLLGRLLGGWELSGLTTYQGGFALSPGITGPRTGLATRPDRAGAELFGPGTRTVGRWFNPAAFTDPAPGKFGSAGRGIIRGPGFGIWDMAAIKSFAFAVGGRETRLSLRAEAFNVFNHVNFRDINTQLNSGTYGSVTSVREPRQMQLSLRYEF
jgi:Carboxypeptidase regulatory-like domain